LAVIDAVRSGVDVRVQTNDVDAFTLTTPARAVTIDGAGVRVRPAPSLSFAKSGGRWVTSAAPAVAPVRGPILEAVNSRHIYVYGAGDEQSQRSADAAAADPPRVHQLECP
jgi:hypothetical protein